MLDNDMIRLTQKLNMILEHKEKPKNKSKSESFDSTGDSKE